MSTEVMPLTIGTKTVNTQGITISVHIDGKKYSNKTQQKKHCMLKRGSKKGGYEDLLDCMLSMCCQYKVDGGTEYW